MEQYQTLIGVVLEKLEQTYKEMRFNYDGLSSILQQHTEEEKQTVPELITIAELRNGYAEFLRAMEARYPGLRSEN
ncbi:hypothetical protein J31TS4_02970 [Paenibacillus sp. J31TS4]|uniref:hypothetical protein n=1 Tax=Paenibacillus sp. J31TS4 TaxID=2807195 RepID=UPI001B1A12A4|nr:hypothetical protein [Paenibacillus sp. J31TS4]GIP37017.1 hypothetical protein J31TS4_02970 [Paenibacillus sp. J31TS4]